MIKFGNEEDAATIDESNLYLKLNYEDATTTNYVDLA